MFSQALRTLCFISLCFSGSIQAMELEYAGFYQYLKGADDVAYNRVRPAFHLIKSDRRGDACAIKQAQIRVLAGANPLDVDEQFPLTYDPSTGEFFVPYDKRLKDKRASLWFDVPELCVLKMAVIGKLEGKDFDSKDVLETANQIYALMRNYAGIMRFFMPDWEGVVFHSNSESKTVSKELLSEAIHLPFQANYISLKMNSK